jgi:hypothetical protein
MKLDRVFYRKENGQVFECFKNKPMVETNENVGEVFLQGRKNKTRSIAFSEEQVNALRLGLELEHLTDAESSIEMYHDYGIISDTEYKRLKSFISDKVQV